MQKEGCCCKLRPQGFTWLASQLLRAFERLEKRVGTGGGKQAKPSQRLSEDVSKEEAEKIGWRRLACVPKQKEAVWGAGSAGSGCSM